jgi:hypothetical protein
MTARSQFLIDDDDKSLLMFIVVYYNGVFIYESINRDLKTKPVYECRCDERLKTKSEESTRLVYTGFLGGLEHLKIKTRFGILDPIFSLYLLFIMNR